MWLRKCFLACLTLAALCACASAARLTWDANTESDLAGYKIHYGISSGQYTATVDVGNVTQWEIPAEWPRDQSYYFAATAYGTCYHCPNDVSTCSPEEFERPFECESEYSTETIYYANPVPATNVHVAFHEVAQTMTTYFGECNADGSLLGTPAGYDYGGAAVVANINATYTCPGSGTQNIDSIGIYSRSGGTSGVIRCAIFDTSWNLICQWDATINVTDDTPAWREKLAANLTGTLTLTGGVSYKLVYAPPSGDFPQVGYNTGSSNDWMWAAEDYIGGFPASIDAPAGGSTAGRAIMRIGVTAAGGTSVVPIIMRQYRARRD